MGGFFWLDGDDYKPCCSGVGIEMPIHNLIGYHVSAEYCDLLHALWLGTARDAVGSHLMVLAKHMPGATQLELWDMRLQFVHEDFKAWAKDHGIRPSTIDEISS